MIMRKIASAAVVTVLLLTVLNSCVYNEQVVYENDVIFANQTDYVVTIETEKFDAAGRPDMDSPFPEKITIPAGENFVWHSSTACEVCPLPFHDNDNVSIFFDGKLMYKYMGLEDKEGNPNRRKYYEVRSLGGGDYEYILHIDTETYGMP